MRSGFFISSIFFFTKAPDFFFFASVKACATLMLLTSRCGFYSLGFDPFDEFGLLLFEADDADDLFKLLLDFTFLISMRAAHQI